MPAYGAGPIFAERSSDTCGRGRRDDFRAVLDGDVAQGTEYLPKPFTLDALADKVRKVLDD